MLPMLEITWIGEVGIVVDINLVVCVAYIGNDLNSEPKFSAMLLAAGFLLISDYNWLTRLFSIIIIIIVIIVIVIVTIIIINTFPAPWWWSLSSFCRHTHLLVDHNNNYNNNNNDNNNDNDNNLLLGDQLQRENDLSHWQGVRHDRVSRSSSLSSTLSSSLSFFRVFTWCHLYLPDKSLSFPIVICILLICTSTHLTFTICFLIKRFNCFVSANIQPVNVW